MATASQPSTPSDSNSCPSCQLPILDHSQPLPAHGRAISACGVCHPWVKSSLDRHQLLSAFNPDQTLELAAELEELYDYPGTLWGDGYSMGGSWFGPLNSSAWAVTLELFPHPNQSLIRHLRQHQKTMGARAASTFYEFAPRVAMKGLSESQILHVIWILNPDSVFGMQDPVMFERFKAMLAVFSTPPNAFLRRSLSPWAKSFQWVHRLVERLPTAKFILQGIEVTGTSGNCYHILPNDSPPFYQVRRIHNDRSDFVCIDLDPRGKRDVVFGDILVALTLSLANDKETVLQITTLQQHVFGWRANRRYHRRRHNALDHLFARAHGTAPVQGTEHDHLVDWPNRMRHLVNRFQTNLHDFTEEE